MDVTVESAPTGGVKGLDSGVVRQKKSQPRPWELLGQICHSSHDEEAYFWWQMTGNVLGILMEEAGYDFNRQCLGLIFHLRYIIDKFGPARLSKNVPLAWQSFMTDDFSPIEYSWNWDDVKSGPKIRYSIEAINASSGTYKDPFNQIPTIQLCSQLRSDFPEVDWRCFDTVRETFCDQRAAGQITRSTNPTNSSHSSQSSVFLAFELGKSIAMKAYFVPVKAEQQGISRWSVVSEAIERLSENGLSFRAYDTLLEYLKTSQGRELEVIGVAIDCVAPEDSRLKLYVRSPRSSFQSVREMMSLGGRIPAPAENSMTELKELWRLTLGLKEDFSEDDELVCHAHETAGVLYNFDIKANKSIPEPKLYIPVKHYAKNDLAAATGLVDFLRIRGRDAYAANYMRALKRVCTHRRLSHGRGLQTYIGTGFRKDGSLALCSYLNGEVYHPWRQDLEFRQNEKSFRVLA